MGGTEPRGHHGRLRRAASVLVLSGSVAVGAVAVGIGDSPASEHNVITGQHCSSTGGGNVNANPGPLTTAPSGDRRALDAIALDVAAM